MPSAIVTTIGSASANSYVTEAEAETFFDDQPNATAWEDGDDDEKTRSLIAAASRLQRENWIGSRVDSTQKLAWPRVDAAKPDGVTGGFFGSTGMGWGNIEVYASTEIPQEVKDAQCLLAFSMLNGYGQANGSTVTSFSDDKMSVTYGATRSETVLPEDVTRLLAPLIQGPQLRRA